MVFRQKYFVLIAGITAVFALIWLVLRFSPYPELERFLARPGSVRYYDRYGQLLQITPLAEGLRRETPLSIPAHIKDVFVFAEDRRFYRHSGIDGIALMRAFFQNIRGGRQVSGASTITMQLARLIRLESHPDQASGINRAAGRKLNEAINALRLEARLSKNEILELYLLSLPFGFNSEGVATAARTFFAEELSMLSPAQVFCLAVIPRRPSLYNPLLNPQACIAAASNLQERFSNNKKLSRTWPLLAQISEDDWKFTSSSARRFEYPFELPHLIRSIHTIFPNTEVSGGEVWLTIDLALQKYLEGVIAGNVMRHSSSRLTNGAAIVIDNESGEILAWTGSADFFNTEAAGQIDGVLALNQPGSSMKQFLYAMALEAGFKPTDVIADIQMQFGEREIYIPRNFNNRFNGPMLFRTALGSSLNIPAVYLLYRLGVANFTNHLYTLGFNSLVHSAHDAGLGLALGNAPVSLLELVRAFSVFPRDGVYIPLTVSMENESAVQPKIEGQRIYSADTTRIICSFLSDPGARVLAFGSGRNFRASFPVIFKTGTANQFQSIVALGATPKYSAGVWMGNFTGETVIGRTGSSVPAAIVRDALVFLQGQGTEFFQEPDDWYLQRVCSLSGMMPTSACISIIDEYLRRGETGNPCTWHQMVNGRSAVLFPAEYQRWFNAAVRQGAIDFSSRGLEITSPRDGFVYLTSPGIGMDEIPVEVIGGNDDILHVNFNGDMFTVRRPFVFFLPRIPGFHTLRVYNGDESKEIMFTVEH
jgi:penicillin-binding protein 1C